MRDFFVPCEARNVIFSNISWLKSFWFVVQINNAGTNKGFRPLLQFSDEDIQQVNLIISFLVIVFQMFA